MDLYVEMQSWPAKRGTPRPTLVAALTDLEELLRPAQAAGEVNVLARLLRAAEANEASEPEALEVLREMVGDSEPWAQPKCGYCGHGHGEHDDFGECLADRCRCPGWTE